MKAGRQKAKAMVEREDERWERECHIRYNDRTKAQRVMRTLFYLTE
jgi:hypothetical protein